MKVYLAGPITGLTLEGADDWRVQAEKALTKSGIKAISPLRSKSYLKDAGVLEASNIDGIFSTNKAVTSRDRFDVMNCDALLVYLPNNGRVSIGTMIELGWADAFRKPVVIIREKDSTYDHAMVNEIAGWIVNSVEDGVHAIKGILH